MVRLQKQMSLVKIYMLKHLHLVDSQKQSFVFGYPPSEDVSAYRSLLETFAFGVLPYIIVMSCVSAILWYWGVLPFIVNLISKGCQRLFNIGGPVGLDQLGLQY